MELRHLRYFYAVAREMNFTKAAEALHIAQPPLSRQIRDLEEELGVRLFIRRPHFMALTPEGELLKQYAAQILDLADKAAENVREIGRGLNGTINISTIEGRTLQVLSEWIASFSAQHPAVRYNIWTGGTDEITTRIRNGLCDFAIAQDVRETPGICCESLFIENWTALIPGDYAAAALTGETIEKDELLPYELIIPMRTGRQEEILSWFTEGKPRIRCRFTHVMTAYELARQSMGIAIFPGTAPDFLQAQSRDGRVVLKALSGVPTRPEYVLLYSEDRTLPNVVQQFMEHILESAR